MKLDEYFSELRESGRLDSTGVFTLDPDSLQGKMARFQLADSEDYCLFLLRAAVIGEINGFHVTFKKLGGHQAEFFFPGLSFGLQELQQILSPLRDTELHPAAPALRTALSAASRLWRVDITSISESEMVSLVSEGTTVTFRGLQPSESKPKGLTFRVKGERLPDPKHLLSARGRWAPITWNVVPQPLKISDRDCSPTMSILIYRSDIRVCEQLKAKLPITEAFWHSEHPGLHFLSWKPDLHLDSKLFGLKDGLLYPLEIHAMPNQLRGIVDASDLKLDLSLKGFVRDEAWERKHGVIHSGFRRLLTRLCETETGLGSYALSEGRSYVSSHWSEFEEEELEVIYRQFGEPSPPTSQDDMERAFDDTPKELVKHEAEVYFRAYRQRASRARTRDPDQALFWIRAARRFQSLLELEKPDFKLYGAVLNYLSSGQAISPGTRKSVPFVSQLAQHVGSKERPLRVAEFEKCDVHESWFLPLFLAESLESGSGRFPQPVNVVPFPYEIARLLLLGRFERALGAIDAASDSQVNHDRLSWKAIIKKHFAGRISWSLAVRLHVQGFFGVAGHNGAALREYEKMRSPGLNTGNPLADRYVFEKNFWPIALLVTFDPEVRRDHRASRYWCRVLLQAALGFPGREDTIEETLSRPLVLPMC